MKKRIFLFGLLCAFSGAIFGQDLRVILINQPSTACGHTNSENVIITINNASGTDTAFAPYDITYTINNGTPVTQTITGSANDILPGGFSFQTFSTTADLSSAGVYDFKSWATITGDVDNSNDTAYKTVNSDANTVPGVLMESDTVCQNANGDTLDLVGNLGNVVGWLESTDNGMSWSVLGAAGTDSSYEYTNLTQTTWFTVVVRNGSCPFDSATPAIIQVDSASDASSVNFIGAGNVCLGSTGNIVAQNGTFSGAIINWDTASAPGGPFNAVVPTETSNIWGYSNLQNDLYARIRVKLGVCPEDTSAAAVVTVDPLTAGGNGALLSGATDTTICEGNSAGTAVVTGYTGNVTQWEVSTTGPTGTYTSIGFAGLDTVTLPTATTTSYFRARIQSGLCPDSASTPIEVNVDALSNGGAVGPVLSTICEGTSQGLSLTGNNGTIQFWEERTSSTNWAQILPPVTGANFTYSNADSTRLFRVIVKNGVCPTTPSDSALVIVLDSVVGGSIITADPQTVCENNNTGTLVLTGYVGTPSNWQFSENNGASFQNVIPTNATDTLVYNNIDTTTIYRVQVGNAACPDAFSDTVIITVLPAAVSGTIAGTTPVCAGDSTTLNLTGENGTVTIWRVSTNGGTSYSNVAGSAGMTSITVPVSTTSQYQAIVQLNPSCDADTTTDFVVNVDPLTVPGTVSGSTIVCGGNNSGSLTLAGETGTNLGWIFSTNGGASWTLTTNTTSTFNYTNLTQTTIFAVTVQSGVCEEDTSTTGTITVIPAGVGGNVSILAPNDSLCAGIDTVTLSLSGHTGTVVGWEASENGGASYTIVPGATGALTIFSYNFTTNTLFRALVRNGVSCDTVRSDSVLFVIGTASVGGNTAGADSVCSASNNGFVTLSGQTGDVIRWESSTNGGFTWSPEANSDSVAFNYSGLITTTLYRAIVQDAGCTPAISDTVEIFVLPGDIPGAVNYTGGNVCSGAEVFSMNLTGSSGTIIRWEKSPDGTVWSPISNTTTSLTDSNITATTHYRAVLQSDTSCPEAPSTPDTVFVDPQADYNAISGTAQFCDTSVSGTVQVTGFTGNVFAWQRSDNGGAFSNLPSSDTATLAYSALPGGVYQYRAIIESGVCPNDTSPAVTVTVDSTAVGGVLSGGTSYCDTVNSTLLTLSGYVDSVVVWQMSTNGGASFSNIPASTNRDTITFNNITTSTIYRVIVSSGLCGNDTSNTQNIDVGLTVGGNLASSDSVCISGFNGVLRLSGQVGTILTWQDSLPGLGWVDQVPANTTDSFVYSDANVLQTTSYRVVVQSGTCDSAFSSIATITVNDTVFAGSLGPNNLFFCDTVNTDTLLLSGYFGPIRNWQVATNGGPFVDFAPAKTDSAFIFNNLTDSISVYRVIMDGGVCGSDTSNNDTVRVSASLAGVLMSGDTVCAGNNSGIISLTNFSGAIISWDSSNAGGPFIPTGFTGSSLIYNDISDTITYRVRVQNPGCPADTSNEVTILAVPGSNVGLLTGSRSICASTYQDSIILIGRNGTIDRWEVSIDTGQTWTTVTGQTSDTLIYTQTTLTQSSLFRVILTASGICPADTSNLVAIAIGPSDAGFISGDTLLCAGSGADLVLNGFVGDVQLWEASADSLIWGPLPSTDTNQITITVNALTWFRAIVQSDTCTPDTSVAFRVDVDFPFAGSLQTPTNMLCYGVGSDTIFIVPPSDTVFDWEIRPDNLPSFTSLNNQTFFQTYDTLKITTHYRAFVKNGICPVDTIEITMTVDTPTVSGILAMDDTVCAGSNSGTLTISGFIGDNFTWQSSADGISFGPAPGATNDTFYVYNNLLTTTYYRVVIASGGCPPDTTNTIEIFVKPAAIGGVISSDTSFCNEPNGGVLNLVGYNGTIVGWQESIGGGSFTNVIPPVTADSLVYNNVDTTTSYRVILSLGDCPDDTSTVATITILPTPVTTVTANGPTEFCEPGSVALTATGGPGYTWSTGDSTETITVSATGTYGVIVTDTASGCEDTDSLSVLVFPAPNVDAGSNSTILEGQSVTLNASGAQTYEWTPKSGLSDGFIPNPVATPTDTTVYFVVGLDSNGCEGQDSVIIAVITDGGDGPPDFTNLFTPNGDGHNDTWKIRDLAGCSTCRVSIYNRYGQQVLQDDNYQDDWEGDDLPDGTYFYVVETETGKIYKGSITILRGN